MTQDTIGHEEEGIIGATEAQSAPPLCLVHYFAERSSPPPEREPHPLGGLARGRVVERRDNLIILEFAPPPASDRQRGRLPHKSILARACDGLLLLLLLASFAACVAAFRF